MNEFIYEKNDDLIFKSKMQWWKCSICSNEWKATVIKRMQGKQRCSNCFPLDYKISSNNFISKNKLLLKEWMFEKNTIDPTKTSVNIKKKVFWKCSFCNNEWQARVDSRALSNSGCPKRCHCKTYLKIE